ncbi:MAG: adenylosuccinate synthase [Thermoanaerobaculia bacterium]
MTNTIINGMQWGDEGKGKIVDLLCPAFDVVVRYQGGDNAGHTVKFADRHFALHLVPSGVLHPETLCVLGSGMVINPDTLFRELDGLAEAGVDFEGRFFISKRAHVVLPIYPVLDQARESAMGKSQIGTTVRGIGPAYESKITRYGVRMGDLVSAEWESRVEDQVERLGREIVALGGDAPDAPEVVSRCRDWIDRLRPLMAETEVLLNSWIGEGKNLLFEGAQGALLDVDHGTYPYVTSSSPTAGGACTGSGVPPTSIDGVIGVLKAYTTRVGGGPFATELLDETGEQLRERGNEFGTTTGRPRRCGWLDLVAAGHARMLSGVDSIALTKLDVLDELDEIKICVGYRLDGELVKSFPPSLGVLERAEPVYESLSGWKQNTIGIVKFSDLPQAAQDYISFIEEQLGVGVGIVSTGPRREETIVRRDETLSRLTTGGWSEIVEGAAEVEPSTRS